MGPFSETPAPDPYTPAIGGSPGSLFRPGRAGGLGWAGPPLPPSLSKSLDRTLAPQPSPRALRSPGWGVGGRVPSYVLL